jgi:anti-anti-sigma factor
VSVLASVSDQWHGDIPVARVEGEVDASNAEEIGVRLRALLTNRSTTLVVDLSDTSYLDSAGINLLFTLADELRGRQQTLRLVVPDGTPIARVVAITSLDKAYATHATVADALA